MTGPVVAHLADLHLRLDGPRADECQRILRWIAEDVRQHRPDLTVIAGDIYDRRSTADERWWIAEWLRELAAAAPVVLVPGNHDDPRDVMLLGRLDVGDAHSVEVCTRPQLLPGRGGVDLFTLPWPGIAGIAASGIADRRTVARDALRDILRGFGAGPDTRRPSLLLGHVNVLGASMDSGQPVAPDTGISITLDDLLLAGTGGCALGHIHAAQELRATVPIHYAGCPYRHDYGEADNVPQYLLWRWDGTTWQVEARPTPAQRMVLVEMTWDAAEAALSGAVPRDVSAADIRLRVTYQAEHRTAVRRALGELESGLREAGAAHVTLDERPEAVQRLRSVDYAAATGGAATVEARVRAWAAATEQVVPRRLSERLLELEEAT